MHIHFIGVCGTGMGALAGLFKTQGHRVSGSDTGFYPPMGPALREWGVELKEGFSAEHVADTPDLVVIGNVCRKDNVEARAAIDGGLAYTSFPQALQERVLPGRKSLVVAGTHGKTTTSSLLAYMLHQAGKDPSFLIGGLPVDFEHSFRLGRSELNEDVVAAPPIVLEGDEYDTVFYEKRPKFLRYNAFGAIITSIEHDHIDIYPDEASYLKAFIDFVETIPKEGLLVAWAGDPKVRAVAEVAKCRVIYYALSDDDVGDVTPSWVAAMVGASSAAQPFDLFGSGSFCGRVMSPLSGRHNVRNLLAAMALAAEGAGAALSDILNAVPKFGGIRRRQELIGQVGDVLVYEDFAHHPTAVRETLNGLKARHPSSRLVAVFEPRSATASRNLHQESYPAAFSAADISIIAPVGRASIPESLRLSTDELVGAINSRGGSAVNPANLDDVLKAILEEAQGSVVVVLMSNGAFGGIYDKVLANLAATHCSLSAAT